MPWPPSESREFYPANWSQSRSGRPIVAIVAHGTAGTDSRAYLQRGGDAPDGSDRQVSIHVLISKDGTIYRMVDDSRGANHAGFGTMPKGMPQVNPNLVTLSFELENLQDGKDPYPDAQLLAMGYQINRWRQQFGALPILRHGDIDPTRRRDPIGLSVPQIEQWCQRAAAMTPPAPVLPDVPYFVDQQPIDRDRMTSLFVSRNAPIQPLEIIDLWALLTTRNVNAALFLAHWHAEDANWQCQSAGGKLFNPFNIKARQDMPSTNGWLDFTGGAGGGGGLWLGLHFTVIWLKWSYAAERKLYTLRQIAPVWLTGASALTPAVDAYINRILTTYQAIVR